MYHIERDDIQNQLRDHGIDPDHIKSLHVKLQTGELDRNSFVIDNSRLRVPTESDVDHLTDLDQTELQQKGITALQNDELLVFWLNGGAATRYFDDSKILNDEKNRYSKQLDTITNEIRQSPKGITPVVNGMSYLELKIRNVLAITKQYKLSVHPQILLMNSFLTDEPTRELLQTLFVKYPDLDPARFHFVIQQPTIPRFQQVEDLKNIDLFVKQDNTLSFAPCGHGDFIYLLQEYLRKTHIPNVRYMFFANIDNLGSTIEPALLGYHIEKSTGRTVELATKLPGDAGGAPCFVDDELIIVEQMKFPPEFDQTTIPWFNTNTFWFTLKDLQAFEEDLPLVLAEKSIAEGDVIQLEHFACDVNVPSKYIVVPRETRFWPVKRFVDLLIYQDPSTSGTIHSKFLALMHRAYEIDLD